MKSLSQLVAELKGFFNGKVESSNIDDYFTSDDYDYFDDMLTGMEFAELNECGLVDYSFVYEGYLNENSMEDNSTLTYKSSRLEDKSTVLTTKQIMNGCSLSGFQPLVATKIKGIPFYLVVQIFVLD